MIAAIVCREFGWTIYEYEEQPADFIEVVTRMISVENAEQNRRNNIK